MKILVGYDGSNVAKAALKLARKRANYFGAQIEVVKSISQSRRLRYEEIRKAESDLAHDVMKILDKDFVQKNTHLVVSSHNPGEEIVGFIKNYKIDEIIVGAPKRTRIGKLLFGSTAQYIILNAPCPVVTIH